MNTDYSQNEQSNNSHEPLPTGNYEMIIKSAQERSTPKGKETLTIDLIVRNDLDKVPSLSKTNAKYHNRHVFMDNWKRRDGSGYDMSSFQYILEAAQIPEGTTLNTVNDFIKVLANKPVKVYVKVEDDNYSGETKQINRVAGWDFSKTDYAEVNHVFKDQSDGNNPFADSSVAPNDPFASNGQSIDISNDDLPF